MSQIINGHLVIFYPATSCWTVDGCRSAYSLSELASLVGLQIDLLEAVLHVF